MVEIEIGAKNASPIEDGRNTPAIVITARLYFYFGLLVLAGNVFLTFTDEFGTLDLITLIINVVLLVMLILGQPNFSKIRFSTHSHGSAF